MKSFMIKVISPLVVVLVALTIFGFVPQLGANEVHAEDQKPALIVKDPEGKEDLCYDGTQQTLVVPGEAYGGTIKELV